MSLPVRLQMSRKWRVRFEVVVVFFPRSRLLCSWSSSHPPSLSHRYTATAPDPGSSRSLFGLVFHPSIIPETRKLYTLSSFGSQETRNKILDTHRVAPSQATLSNYNRLYRRHGRTLKTVQSFSSHSDIVSWPTRIVVTVWLRVPVHFTPPLVAPVIHYFLRYVVFSKTPDLSFDIRFCLEFPLPL